jgi:hypothetical protein
MPKTSREHLADNLTRLMAERQLSTGRLAVEGLVDQKTVWRMANATNETGTDKLDAVARKIGDIEAWQLLAPNLGRRNVAVEEVLRRLDELDAGPSIPADLDDLVRRIASAPNRAKAIRAAQQAVIRLLEPEPPEPPPAPAAPAPSANAPASPPPKRARSRNR